MGEGCNDAVPEISILAVVDKNTSNSLSSRSAAAVGPSDVWDDASVEEEVVRPYLLGP